MKELFRGMKTFLILWSTQSLSQLGSAMTSFALTLWLYEKTGSALETALLSICSYAPYVIMSIFAGAISDRWDKKKIMLVCDTLAAVTTITVLVLYKTETLEPVHMYILNALNGLMNTVQQPASDVAMTLIVPKDKYQKISGLRSFSNSLVTILHPVLATAVYAFMGLEGVIYIDLATFVTAFLALLLFIRLPSLAFDAEEKKESLLASVKGALVYLKDNRLILLLIVFLAGVNLVASAFNATLPALILPRENGGDAVLGIILSFGGVATLIGSVFVTLLPAPKNRVRIIIITMLISLSTENFMLSFCREPFLWCISQVVGWLPVPLMGANFDVIMRSTIPPHMQGRIYASRNTLQFFTIPVGFFLGGLFVDKVCEPVMASTSSSLLHTVFGFGKGSGAAMMMFILGVVGTALCTVFGLILRKYKYEEAK